MRRVSTRDRNACGEVSALIYAHNDAPLERVVGVATYLMDPRCGPNENQTESSLACWFTVGTRSARTLWPEC